MKIRDFQYIDLLDQTGLTYEQDLIKYFNIDTNQTIDEIKNEITKRTSLTQKKIKNSFRLKGKKYKIEKDFIELTYEQFVRLDTLLAEENNIQNLHKLLSIYVRPTNWLGRIKPFNLKTQEKVYEDLLDLDMDTAQSLMLLFFSLATKCLTNINIFFLNHQKRQEQNLPTENKSNKLRSIFRGILPQKIYRKIIS